MISVKTIFERYNKELMKSLIARLAHDGLIITQVGGNELLKELN